MSRHLFRTTEHQQTQKGGKLAAFNQTLKQFKNIANQLADHPRHVEPGANTQPLSSSARSPIAPLRHLGAHQLAAGDIVHF